MNEAALSKSARASMRGRVAVPEALIVRVAEQFAVLGQVARLRIVEQLTSGASTPQELADALGLTQQNVSKHLQILYRAGLVRRRAEGPNVVYSLEGIVASQLFDDVVESVTARLRELSQIAAVPSAADMPTAATAP